MSIKDALASLDDSKLISGIHNYCDRWCERCAFTTRCAVGLAERADPEIDPAGHDINNAAFWQKMTAIFAETREMIEEWAQESGVTFVPEELEEIGKRQEKKRQAARSHPLAKAAEAYARAVSEWFAVTADPELSDLAPETNRDRTEVDDYVEIIRWYQFFIAVKLMRALLWHFEEEADEHSAYDSDGSAKAALVAIDRSLIAWKVMADHEPERSTSIQELMLQLEHIRLTAEREFPAARDFVRPGFDEASVDVMH